MIDFEKYQNKNYKNTLTRKILFNSNITNYDERVSIANRELLKMIRFLKKQGKSIVFIDEPKFIFKKYGDKDLSTICLIGYN